MSKVKRDYVSCWNVWWSPHGECHARKCVVWWYKAQQITILVAFHVWWAIYILCAFLFITDFVKIICYTMNIRCGVVWCGVVWCGVGWCGVVRCGEVWCGEVWSGESDVQWWMWWIERCVCVWIVGIACVVDEVVWVWSIIHKVELLSQTYRVGGGVWVECGWRCWHWPSKGTRYSWHSLVGRGEVEVGVVHGVYHRNIAVQYYVRSLLAIAVRSNTPASLWQCCNTDNKAIQIPLQ